MIKKFALLALICLMAGLVLAEGKESLDACDGVSITFFVFNDARYTAGLTAPGAGTDDLAGCPEDLFVGSPDTMVQIHFPDTLAWPNKIDSLLTDHDPNVFGARIYDGSWYNSDEVSPLPDSVEVPPMYDPTCCVNGIYVKARMFDVFTGEYSPWIDVNTTNGVQVIPFPPYLLFLVNSGNFKVRDLSSNMVYDCGDCDSLIIYAWDCYDGDAAGSAGEFGIWASCFADIDAATAGDTVFLKRYDMIGAIGEKAPDKPKEYALSQNSPNPFNARTQIQYALPEDADVRIDITNILGNRVRTLVDGHETSGYKSVVWNGLDDSGKEVASGVYFYTIRANDFNAKKRAILMK